MSLELCCRSDESKLRKFEASPGFASLLARSRAVVQRTSGCVKTRRERQRLQIHLYVRGRYEYVRYILPYFRTRCRHQFPFKMQGW